MFHVYILRSLRNSKLYIGHTDDLERRLAEHNGGRGGKFTRQNGPWQLAHAEPHPDRSAAMKRERYLKSVDGSREKKRLAGERKAG
ncbi:MAG: GIY-YIG nuclease family protein [Phycisphaerae bacterium]|nr:GIY-YIG nuclease family protein [Phycisphaerae bacterium]